MGKYLLALALGGDAEAARELAVGENFGGVVGKHAQDLVLGDGCGFGLFALGAGSLLVFFGGIHLGKSGRRKVDWSQAARAEK